MSDLPVIYDTSGPVAKTPSQLRDSLKAEAIALSPGLTTELPGSLIEDMTSTGTGGLIVMDQARIDAIRSVGPLTANEAMLTDLAQQYGVPPIKSAGSTTVPVRFSGTPNFLVPAGFVVSDGVHQYAIDKSALIRSDGTSPAVTAVSTTSGSWPVPANTVRSVVTAIPQGITVTVNNLVSGTAASLAETPEQFRDRVWEAGMSTVQGYPGIIRTELNKVDNVDPRQVSVVQNGDKWSVMTGGGDTYDQAAAIFRSAGDITRIVGSSLNVTGITKANPGVVSTDLTHGFTTGQVIRMTGVQGMTQVNGVDYTITVIDPRSFSIGVNTSSYGTWTAGGVVSPNLRNVSISINDWPDTFTVNYVQPLLQLVTVQFRWQTQSISYLSDTLLLALVQNNVIDYINSIYAGKPLNLNTLKAVFLESISNTVDTTLITTLSVSVVVNGMLTNPNPGTDIISGDKFSYWYIAEDGVSVAEV